MSEKNEKRREQLRLAQARRREKRRAEGIVMLEIPISRAEHEILKEQSRTKGITITDLVKKMISVIRDKNNSIDRNTPHES